MKYKTNNGKSTYHLAAITMFTYQYVKLLQHNTTVHWTQATELAGSRARSCGWLQRGPCSPMCDPLMSSVCALLQFSDAADNKVAPPPPIIRQSNAAADPQVAYSRRRGDSDTLLNYIYSSSADTATIGNGPVDTTTTGQRTRRPEVHVCLVVNTTTGRARE